MENPIKIDDLGVPLFLETYDVYLWCFVSNSSPSAAGAACDSKERDFPIPPLSSHIQRVKP